MGELVLLPARRQPPPTCPAHGSSEIDDVRARLAVRIVRMSDDEILALVQREPELTRGA